MLQKHLLGTSQDSDGQVDVGGILRRLLLFETYTMESKQLQELPAIVERLGLEETLSLLDCGAFKIYLDAFSIAQNGQLQRRLPIGS